MKIFNHFIGGEKANMNIKVGVIGAGAFGENHIAAFQTLPGVEVAAICDPRPARLKEISKKYGIRHCYTEFEKLCARKDIEIVSIVTPETVHLAPVLAATRNKKHILLEKPIATSVKRARGLSRPPKRPASISWWVTFCDLKTTTEP